MAGEADKFTILVGLEVKDPARYAEYRARMTPILHALGGAFRLDLEVSRDPSVPPTETIARAIEQGGALLERAGA